jgi:hypothetical protein
VHRFIRQILLGGACLLIPAKASDARAIATYLKSLPPAKRQIPANVSAGVASQEPFIRIGVFYFDPGVLASGKGPDSE